ncbi:MAG: methylenetetrahydrofolate reductase, partial [Deltaproteobacteria bacterium]|nr:methylenetetrahydrofolate reductase [Deltaproteobacteria bacterium]
MRICDLFAKGEPVVSFEFFPPKTDAGVEALYRTIAALKPCGPSFVSVTYGTGGGSRNLTIDLVERVKGELGIETLAHLTCAEATQGDILIMCRRLATAGIENVLALRGDPPEGTKEFRKPDGGFAHANELIQFIRDEGFDFCVGAACYPEGHPETPDLEKDLTHLKRKVDSGVDFLIS